MSSSLRTVSPSHPILRIVGLAGVTLPLVALLGACGAKDAAPGAAGAGAPSGPPPATVGVVTVANESVALQTELPGRVSPLRVAQVRARVNGVVQKRLFREGSEVQAGQPLYQIDPPFTRPRWTAPRPAWPRPRPTWPRATATGRALPAAGRSQGGQQAGICQRWRPPRSG
jgi:membrane fusion protein (multidrug efflux system)